MTQELIIVKQLPVIEERLKTIRAQIEERTEEALSLACTEDTVKAIKKVRTELSKDFKELETQRKAVKSKVLAPYEQFEAIYKSCVTEVYAPADAELKRRIDEVENALKEDKQQEASAFFTEYATAKGIDFVDFNSSSIQVNMSVSPKALRAASTEYLDRIGEELALIDTQEHKEEILVEYKQSLNVANAITNVTRRHEAVEAERKRQEETRLLREQRNAVAIKAFESAFEETLMPPTLQTPAAEDADIPPEPVATYSATFTVTGTLEQLKAVKEFLENGGYHYESIK